VAEQRKQEIMQEELLRLRAASVRVGQVLQLSRQKKEREQQRLKEKIQRGLHRKEEHLQAVVHKALSENVKVDEVRFIREIEGYSGPNFDLLDSSVSKTKEAEARREAHLKRIQQKAAQKNEKIEEIQQLQSKRAQEERDQHERKLLREQEAEQRRQQAHSQKVLNQKAKEDEVQRNKIALEERKQAPSMDRRGRGDTAERLAAAERRKQAALDEKTSRAARDLQKVAEAQARKEDQTQARVDKYKEKQQEIEQRRERSRSLSIAPEEASSPPLHARSPEEMSVSGQRGSPSHLGRERPQSVAKQTVPPPSLPEAHEKSRAKKAKKARQQLGAAVKEYRWTEPETPELERVLSSEKLPSRVHELIRQLEKRSIEGLEAVCYEIGHLIEVPEGINPDNATAEQKKKAQVMRRLGGLSALASICERCVIDSPTPRLLHLAIKAIYNALLPSAENRLFFFVQGHALLLLSLLAPQVEVNDKALPRLLGATICLLQTTPKGQAEMAIKELTISAAVYGGTLTFVRQLLSRHASALHTLAPAEEERKRSRGSKKNAKGGAKKEDLFGVNVLQQCVYFLELITAYSEHSKGDVGESSHEYGGAVVEGMRESGIGGLLSLLSAIVVEIGTGGGMQLTPPLVAVVITALSTLNNMADLNLECVQYTLGSPGFQGEVLHIFGSLLSTCNRHLAVGLDLAPKRKEVTVLVHEMVLLVGFYAVENEANQASLSYGTRSIITQLCDLPLGYFMHQHLQAVLFPTLIAATHGCERNYRILTQELSLTFLADFLQSGGLPTALSEGLGEDSERFGLHRRFPASACAAAFEIYIADVLAEEEAVEVEVAKGGPCAANELVFDEILSGAVA